MVYGPGNFVYEVNILYVNDFKQIILNRRLISNRLKV